MASAAGRRLGPAPARRAWRRGQLGEERRRPGRVGQHRHPPDAAGDGHVEHPPLLLDAAGRPWARRWGISPSLAPKSATRGHSRPLTRWIVDSTTPASSSGRDSADRSHGSNPAGSGWRSATCSRASRSSRWDCPSPPPEASSRSTARPRPTSSRTCSSSDRLVAPRAWPARSRRSAGQLGQLGRHLEVVDAVGGPLDVVDRAAAAQPLVDPPGQSPAGPPVDLAQIGGVDAVGLGRDPQVGQRRPQAGAGQDVRVQDRRHRHARLHQRHVRPQQGRAHPGEHGHVGRPHLGLVQPGLDDADQAGRTPVGSCSRMRRRASPPAADAARISFGTRTRLRVSRWRAASTTSGGQR